MSSNAFMDNLKQLFSECDINKKGSLGRSEFYELCKKIGLNKDAADETFDRLDSDKNGRITFDEFAAGFNQYKQSASTSAPAAREPRKRSPAKTTTTTSVSNKQSSNSLHNSNPFIDNQTSSTSSTTNGSATQATAAAAAASSSAHASAHKSVSASRRANQQLSPSPVAARARKGASQVGVMSLGSGGSGSGSGSGSTSSSSNLRDSSSISSSSAATTHSSSITKASADYGNASSVSLGASGGASVDAVCEQSPSPANACSNAKDQDVVVYSSEAVSDYYGDKNSGQFGSLVSNSSQLSQLRTMQDLLDCVQKLQSENQILTQIFFKDKREREEYISQLGEEFDQQVREVEERANRRAREELENEKKRLREMMQAERETLQHHYQTIEKMSKLIKSPNGKLEDGETIDKVRSKLEDTFMENRQLKRSLLDTKSDVALIRKEMERLKMQYEDKLSTAYERSNETRSDCDHIKQQLDLMKDSNKKLQDASDVLTTYITDKVEPVIKTVEEGAETSGNFLSPNAYNDRNDPNSRRGSVLSEYLNDANSIEARSASLNSAESADSDRNVKLIKTSSKKENCTDTAKQSTTEECKTQTQDMAKPSGLRNFGRQLFMGRAQSDAKPKTSGDDAHEQSKLNAQNKAMSVDNVDDPMVEPADGPSVATFNIILVGDSFVGKSSFAARFMEGTFVQGIISNCSIDFKTKAYKVAGVNYTVNLWDTAGQERFRSITASYFRKADGIILMYDVTDKRSYINVRNWMSTIADTASENVAVLLIGNKIDLRTKSNIDKCVPTEEGFRLAKEYDVVFLETSVKTGTNLVPSMGKLIKLIAKNNMPEEDTDRIRLNDKNRMFQCMPKNC